MVHRVSSARTLGTLAASALLGFSCLACKEPPSPPRAATSATTDAADVGSSAEPELLKRAAASGPCGDYENDAATWSTFSFLDDLFVDIAPLGAKRTWIPIDGGVAVRTDKGFFTFSVIDADTLRGTDEWTRGLEWKRRAPPQRPCGVTSPRELEARFEHDRCYFGALSLQQQGEVESAMRSFQVCCDRGGASACGQLGNLLYLSTTGDRSKARILFQKACDGGDGQGCRGLAREALAKGDKTSAKAWFEKACEAGELESCADKVLYDDEH